MTRSKKVEQPVVDPKVVALRAFGTVKFYTEENAQKREKAIAVFKEHEAKYGTAAAVEDKTAAILASKVVPVELWQDLNDAVTSMVYLAEIVSEEVELNRARRAACLVCVEKAAAALAAWREKELAQFMRSADAYRTSSAPDTRAAAWYRDDERRKQFSIIDDVLAYLAEAVVGYHAVYGNETCE